MAIVDEIQDSYIGHPERKAVYDKQAKTLSRLGLQIIYLSGSHPPHLHKLWCKMTKAPLSIRVIRASTDRPEIGLHVIRHYIEETGVPIWTALKRTVQALTMELTEKDRIIVFFMSHHEADNFARQTKSAVYHSQLPKIGNTRSYNMSLWDSGEAKVLAATTALAYGVNRSHVKYAVIFEGSYGLVTFAQEVGRIGRAGHPAEAFLLVNARSNRVLIHTKAAYAKDSECRIDMDNYARNLSICHRFFLLKVLDGSDRARTCFDVPGSNACNVCQPDKSIVALVIKAIINPTPLARPRSNTTSYQQISATRPSVIQRPSTSSSEDFYEDEEFTPEMAQAMDQFSLHGLPSVRHIFFNL